MKHRRLESSPWSTEEHERFLSGLEQCASNGNQDEWQAIASVVQTKSIAQVQTHAKSYFETLQTANSQRNHGAPWTFDEEKNFETRLATYSRTGIEIPWHNFAHAFPKRSAKELYQRFVYLCHDLARIEHGQHVTVFYAPAENHLPFTLCDSEHDILLLALHQIQAQTHMHARVAELLTLAFSNTRSYRSHEPRFQIEQAKIALSGIFYRLQMCGTADIALIMNELAVQLCGHNGSIDFPANESALPAALYHLSMGQQT